MKVKSQIYFSSLLLVLLISSLAIVLFFFSSRINRELATENTVDEIVNGITELVIIAGDYMAYPYARKVRQWDARYHEVESLVHGLTQDNAFDDLQANLKLLNQLFGKLTEEIKNDKQSLLSDRISGRIRFVSHELVTRGTRIIADKNQRVKSFQKKGKAVLLLLSLLLVVVSLVSAFITIKSIAAPLKQLTADAESISQGDFDRILEHTRDTNEKKNEFGELKQAFQTMAAKLNKTINSLHLSEESLRESENRYRRLFEESPISLWEEDFSALKIHIEQLRSSGISDFRSYFESHPESVDRCTQLIKITDVNRETLRMLGAENKEFLFENLNTVFGKESYDAFQEELVYLAEGNYNFELQTTNQTLQGDEVQIILGLTVVPGYEDTWSKVLVSLSDVTKLMEAEAKLSEYRNHLEELVEKRTEELKEKTDKVEKSSKALSYLLEDVNASRKELQQVNSDYSAANKELKEFAYIVSHDLKAPLRAISQLSHWIAEDYSEAFDADGREQMALILQRVKRMDALIDGVLRYSRVGRIKENDEELDLSLLITDVIDNIAPPETIQILIETGLPVVFRDPTRMVQVFQNLIENAIKYMDKDEGIIKVGCVDEGTQWKFSVSDNGPGIDKRYHEKIFQIFKTLTSRDEFESTGIGLTLVKKIITLFGGSVWVESEKGCGATFFFTLPKKGGNDEKL